MDGTIKSDIWRGEVWYASDMIIVSVVMIEYTSERVGIGKKFMNMSSARITLSRVVLKALNSFENLRLSDVS